MLKPAVLVLTLLPLAELAWRTATDALGPEPVEALEHGTGIWALRFLLLTLAVTPLRKLTGWNDLQRYRRMLGLVAFGYATVHLLVYALVDLEAQLGEVFADVAEHPYIMAGMLAWLLMLPLAITSTRGWIRRLGARWQKLHRLAYAAGIAAVLHFLWLVKADVREPLLYIALLAVLLGTRVVTSLRRRSAGSPRRVNSRPGLGSE